MINSGAEFDPVVAARIAHDRGIVADHSGEWVHAIRGTLIRRVRGSDLQLTPSIVGNTNEGITVADAGLGDIGLRCIAGARPWGRGDRWLHFDLVDEIKGATGDGVRAAVAEHRLVGRQIRLPTYADHRADLCAQLRENP